MLAEAASLLSEKRPRRDELCAYAIRECLETVPTVFGVPKRHADLRTHLADILESSGGGAEEQLEEDAEAHRPEFVRIDVRTIKRAEEAYDRSVHTRTRRVSEARRVRLA
ncbi:MAG: hypothetical protein OEO77_07345 [Acidimicrobiia bacterium]|nr:hypothetical protein [Acidimicrobiia bacterium]